MSVSLPKQWLDKASEDVAVARLVLKEGHTAHACFLSQQGIEKALKGYLLARINDYPRSHRLTDLLSQSEPLDPGFALFRADCTVVDQYYIPTRYPDGVPGGAPGGTPSKAEAVEAITAADKVLQFVVAQLAITDDPQQDEPPK